MTRDEAFAKANAATDIGQLVPSDIVRILEALGLLKFDEPKSVEERAIEALERIRSPIKHSDLPAILSAAGLKIVEK